MGNGFRNMKVFEVIKVEDENDVKTFLRYLRDFGKRYKAKCSDCGDFTIIYLGFKRNRDYRLFRKLLTDLGYHIEKNKYRYISELNFRVV